MAIQLKNTVLFLVFYVCPCGLLSKIRLLFHGDRIYLFNENGRRFSSGEKGYVSFTHLLQTTTIRDSDE